MATYNWYSKKLREQGLTRMPLNTSIPSDSTPEQLPLIVISTHPGDTGLAQQNIEWQFRLRGNRKGHAAFIAIDTQTSKPHIEILKQSAKDTFGYVEFIGIAAGVKRGTDAANFMFLHTAKTVHERFKTPWLWLEPDAIPLRSGWLEELAIAYSQSPKRYMGAFIRSNDPLLPKTHLSGCAIHPPDAYNDIKPFCDKSRAWDIESADTIIPMAVETSLISHIWGESQEKYPVFVDEKEPESPDNHVTIDFVPRAACLFHRDKKGGLIRLLSKQAHTDAMRESMLATGEAAKRGPGRPKKLEPVTATP